MCMVNYLLGVKCGQFFHSLFAFLLKQVKILTVDLFDGCTGSVMLKLELAQHLFVAISVETAVGLASVHLLRKVCQLLTATCFGIIHMLRPVIETHMMSLQALGTRHGLEKKDIKCIEVTHSLA